MNEEVAYFFKSSIVLMLLQELLNHRKRIPTNRSKRESQKQMNITSYRSLSVLLHTLPLVQQQKRVRGRVFGERCQTVRAMIQRKRHARQ